MTDPVLVRIVGYAVAVFGMIVLIAFCAIFLWCMYDMTKAVQDYFRTMKWLDSLKERDEEKKRLREERRAVSVLRKTDDDANIQEKQ